MFADSEREVTLKKIAVACVEKAFRYYYENPNPALFEEGGTKMQKVAIVVEAKLPLVMRLKLIDVANLIRFSLFRHVIACHVAN